MGRAQEFEIRCPKCRHWLAKAGGDTFVLRLKCSKCTTVVNVEVSAGAMSVAAEWGPRKAVGAVA